MKTILGMLVASSLASSAMAQTCTCVANPETQVINFTLSPTTKPTPSPTPVATPVSTPVPTPTATPVPSPTPQPTATPDPVEGKLLKSGADLAKEVAAAKDGDIFILKAGEYKGGFSIKKSITLRGENCSPILKREMNGKMTQNQEAISKLPVIKGSGDTNVLFDADNIKIQCLNFDGGGKTGSTVADNEYSTNRFMNGRSNILIEDSIFQNTKSIGLTTNGDNYILRRLIARNNGAAGIGGSKGDHGLLEYSLIYNNNGVEKKGDGGGGKWTRTDGMVIRFNEYYENTGPGIWADVWNVNFTVEGNYGHHQKGTSNIHGKCIMLELTGGDKSGKTEGKSIVRNNVCEDNDVDSGRSTKDQQRGILISSSSNVDVLNNTILKNDTICLKDGSRELKTVGILVKDNKMLDGSKIVYDGANKTGVKEENNGPNAPGANF